MEAYNKIKDILYSYEIAGLIECNHVKVLSYLSDDVIGIGMGEQGFVSSKKEISDIMLATIKEDKTATYTLDIKDIVIHLITDSSATLCAKVYVHREFEGSTTTSGFMQSLTFVLRDDKWLISSLHASPIMLTEETIESYPLTFADSTLAKLKSELQQDTFDLMNKNFSGGIMGFYAEEPYSLYFVNDMLLKLLGYEREEFERNYKDGVTKLFQIEGKSLKDIEIGKDFFIRSKCQKKDGTDMWVEICTRKSEDEKGNEVLLSIVTDITEIVVLQMQTENQNKTILSSIRYGSKIQNNLLPSKNLFEEVFHDYGVIWSPKDVIGGDIYWLKKFQKGSVLAVCDCTGHGIPGALLTMLVISILESIVTENNYENTASVLYSLDKKMSNVLKGRGESTLIHAEKIMNISDGCDIALFYIEKGGKVEISAANMYTFICDGEEVKRIKGQKLRIGEGKLESSEDIKTVMIPPNEKNRFYAASDGLFDQIGGNKNSPYGYHNFNKVILEHYKDSQKVIMQKVWDEFEHYRGKNVRRDDIEVITFIP